MENLDAESIATLVKGGVATLSVALGSKPAALFIEKISSALGWYMEPKQIVRKARAEAAASLIKIEADQEAKTLEQRTAARIMNEEIKQQQNMETVVIHSLPNIGEDARPEDLDDDWLASFFDKCRRVSNEDMQRLWSQVLSGEVNKPGSFSSRTLDAISTLSMSEARNFKELTSYIWLNVDNENKPIIIFDEELFQSTDERPEVTEVIMHLQAIGLITLNLSAELTLTSLGGEMNFLYNGKMLNVTKHDASGKKYDIVKGFPIGYVMLTKIGGELSSISSINPDWDYFDRILENWKKAGFQIDEL